MILHLGDDEQKLTMWAIETAIEVAEDVFADDPEWPIDRAILNRLVARLKGLKST